MADLYNISAFTFGILDISVAVVVNALIRSQWALHITETSLVLVYESEDNEVTYTNQFVFVIYTHTS